jgi:acetyltransferase-like isoleucine patch superfamily enzyme
MLKMLMRFFGMYAPVQSIRVAMYRKSGVYIGKQVYLGTSNWLDVNFKSMIYIGDNAALAADDMILSHDILISASADPLVASQAEYDGFKPVIIGKGARLGAHVLVLAGVTIGEFSVIGAGAVVVNDIPPYCLAVGVPAKPIKFFNKKLVNNLKEEKPIESITYIKCKTCGNEIKSAIICKKHQFALLKLQGNRHRCPICGHSNRYNKRDYYFIE